MSTPYSEMKRLLVESGDDDEVRNEYQRTMAELDNALFSVQKLGERLKKLSEEGGMALNGPVDIPRIVVGATDDMKKAMDKVNDIGAVMGYLGKMTGQKEK